MEVVKVGARGVHVWLQSANLAIRAPYMQSKLADPAEQALMKATQRLTPEERLSAFLTHCQPVLESQEQSHA